MEIAGTMRLARLLLVAAVAAGLYAGGLFNGFVFDDHQLVEANPLVAEPGHLHEIFASHYWHPLRPRGYLYRPLTILSLRLDHLFGGGRPVLFHATNLVLHAAVSVMVYLVLSLLYGRRPPPARDAGGEQTPWRANVPLVAALLFAAHPVHTEAVAGIAGRADLLATLFVMAAWWLHLLGRPWITAAAFCLGMLSKESAVVLPGILILSDLCFGVPGAPGVSFRLGILRRHGPPAAALAACLALRAAVLGSPGGGDPSLIAALDNPLVAQTVFVRIATALKVLLLEARLLVFPRDLSADYSFNQIPLVTRVADPWLLSALAAAAAVLACAWFFRKRRYGPAFPILFFFVCIAPVSNLAIPIGTIMAERILYLPALGACAGIALALAWLSSRSARAATAISMAAVFLLGSRTLLRVPEWRSDLTLFTAAASASAASAKAQYNLGMVHLKAGDAGSALPYLQRAVQNAGGMPGGADMMRDLAEALTRLSRQDEAIAVLERARFREPGHLGVLVNLGNAYLARGDLDRALEDYDAALRLDPDHGGALLNRGRLLLRMGMPQEAARDLEQVLRHAPATTDALYYLGDAYLAAGRTAAGARALREFLAKADADRSELAPLARDKLARLSGQTIRGN